MKIGTDIFKVFIFSCFAFANVFASSEEPNKQIENNQTNNTKIIVGGLVVVGVSGAVIIAVGGAPVIIAGAKAAVVAASKVSAAAAAKMPVITVSAKTSAAFSQAASVLKQVSLGVDVCRYTYKATYFARYYIYPTPEQELEYLENEMKKMPTLKEYLKTYES